MTPSHGVPVDARETTETASVTIVSFVESAMAEELVPVQKLVDELLVLLRLRIRNGHLVIHLNDYRVQQVETHLVHKIHKGSPEK